MGTGASKNRQKSISGEVNESLFNSSSSSGSSEMGFLSIGSTESALHRKEHIRMLGRKYSVGLSRVARELGQSGLDPDEQYGMSFNCPPVLDIHKKQAAGTKMNKCQSEVDSCRKDIGKVVECASFPNEDFKEKRSGLKEVYRRVNPNYSDLFRIPDGMLETLQEKMKSGSTDSPLIRQARRSSIHEHNFLNFLNWNEHLCGDDNSDSQRFKLSKRLFESNRPKTEQFGCDRTSYWKMGVGAEPIYRDGFETLKNDSTRPWRVRESAAEVVEEENLSKEAIAELECQLPLVSFQEMPKLVGRIALAKTKLVENNKKERGHGEENAVVMSSGHFEDDLDNASLDQQSHEENVPHSSIRDKSESTVANEILCSSGVQDTDPSDAKRVEADTSKCRGKNSMSSAKEHNCTHELNNPVNSSMDRFVPMEKRSPVFDSVVPQEREWYAETMSCHVFADSDATASESSDLVDYFGTTRKVCYAKENPSVRFKRRKKSGAKKLITSDSSDIETDNQFSKCVSTRMKGKKEFTLAERRHTQSFSAPARRSKKNSCDANPHPFNCKVLSHRRKTIDCPVSLGRRQTNAVGAACFKECRLNSLSLPKKCSKKYCFKEKRIPSAPFLSKKGSLKKNSDNKANTLKHKDKPKVKRSSTKNQKESRDNAKIQLKDHPHSQLNRRTEHNKKIRSPRIIPSDHAKIKFSDVALNNSASGVRHCHQSIEQMLSEQNFSVLDDVPCHLFSNVPDAYYFNCANHVTKINQLRDDVPRSISGPTGKNVEAPVTPSAIEVESSFKNASDMNQSTSPAKLQVIANEMTTGLGKPAVSQDNQCCKLSQGDCKGKTCSLVKDHVSFPSEFSKCEQSAYNNAWHRPMLKTRTASSAEGARNNSANTNLDCENGITVRPAKNSNCTLDGPNNTNNPISMMKSKEFTAGKHKMSDKSCKSFRAGVVAMSREEKSKHKEELLKTAYGVGQCKKSNVEAGHPHVECTHKNRETNLGKKGKELTKLADNVAEREGCQYFYCPAGLSPGFCEIKSHSHSEKRTIQDVLEKKVYEVSANRGSRSRSVLKKGFCPRQKRTNHSDDLKFSPRPERGILQHLEGDPRHHPAPLLKMNPSRHSKPAKHACNSPRKDKCSIKRVEQKPLKRRKLPPIILRSPVSLPRHDMAGYKASISWCPTVSNTSQYKRTVYGILPSSHKMRRFGSRKLSKCKPERSLSAGSKKPSPELETAIQSMPFRDALLREGLDKHDGATCNIVPKSEHAHCSTDGEEIRFEMENRKICDQTCGACSDACSNENNSDHSNAQQKQSFCGANIFDDDHQIKDCGTGQVSSGAKSECKQHNTNCSCGNISWTSAASIVAKDSFFSRLNCNIKSSQFNPKSSQEHFSQDLDETCPAASLLCRQTIHPLNIVISGESKLLKSCKPFRSTFSKTHQGNTDKNTNTYRIPDWVPKSDTNTYNLCESELLCRQELPPDSGRNVPDLTSEHQCSPSLSPQSSWSACSSVCESQKDVLADQFVTDKQLPIDMVSRTTSPFSSDSELPEFPSGDEDENGDCSPRSSSPVAHQRGFMCTGSQCSLYSEDKPNDFARARSEPAYCKHPNIKPVKSAADCASDNNSLSLIKTILEIDERSEAERDDGASWDCNLGIHERQALKDQRKLEASLRVACDLINPAALSSAATKFIHRLCLARALPESCNVLVLIRKMTHLLQLDISHNYVGPHAFRTILKAMVWNSTLTHLNIAYNDGTPDSAEPLGELLQKNSTLCWLDVSGNNLGKTDFSWHVGHALTVNNTLTTLKCSECGISDVREFIGALLQKKTLKYLTMSNNPICGGNHFGSYLATWLQNKPKLIYLDIANCGLSWKAFAMLHQSVKACSTLNVLNISGCEVASHDRLAMFVIVCISKMTLVQLVMNNVSVPRLCKENQIVKVKEVHSISLLSSLSLDNCNLRDSVLKQMESRLSATIPHLRELSLASNPQVTVESLDSFQVMMAGSVSQPCNLQKLNFAGNNANNVHLFLHFSRCPGATYVNLSQSKMSGYTLYNLLPCSANDKDWDDNGCSHVATLVLHGVLLTDGEIMCKTFGRCHLDNLHLSHLDMSACNLGNSDMRQIAKAMQTKTVPLVTLKLSNNYIGDDGIGHLVYALLDSNTLQRLNLSHNKIQDRGAQILSCLFDQWDGNKNRIQSLDVSCNCIGAKGVSGLLKALVSGGSLTRLDASDQKQRHFSENDLMGIFRKLASILGFGMRTYESLLVRGSCDIPPRIPAELSVDVSQPQRLGDKEYLCFNGGFLGQVLDSQAIVTGFSKFTRPYLSLNQALQLAMGLGHPASTDGRFMTDTGHWRQFIQLGQEEPPRWLQDIQSRDKLRRLLYVSNMGSKVSYNKLKAMLREYGCEIQHFHLIRYNLPDGELNGVAWLMLAKDIDVERIMEMCRDGRTIVDGEPVLFSQLELKFVKDLQHVIRKKQAEKVDHQSKDILKALQHLRRVCPDLKTPQFVKLDKVFLPPSRW